MKKRRVADEAAELIEKVKSIISYEERNGSEKPHKGLLLLLVLAQVQDTSVSSISFSKIEKPLQKLIANYSTSRQLRAEYPFWSLQNDRLWEVFSEKRLGSRKGKDFPPRTELVRCQAVGKLPFWIEKLLLKKPYLIAEITEILLNRYFDKTRHREIKKAVGLLPTNDSTESKTTGLI